MSNKAKITVEAQIDAPVEKVWDCYAKPEHITKWNFASDDWHCPSASNDLRVGGKYTARMEAKDGGSGFDFEAIYDEIIKHKMIGYTMSDNRKVRVNFNKLNDKTEVNITFDAENVFSIEQQQEGWQAILNNFRKYVESKKQNHKEVK